MKLNRQLDLITQSPTVAVADRVRALKAAGEHIISLHVGGPDFDTPSAVMEVAIKAMQSGMTHYSPSRGLEELRQAIAEKIAQSIGLKNNSGEPYDPQSEILATHGGVHAYYLALQTILNPGDEVLIPDPSWPTHTNMVKKLRCSVVPVPADMEGNLIPDLSTWEKSITPRTTAIVINYPANPTGYYPDKKYLRSLLEFAVQNDLWIISDEVYDHIYFDEQPVSVGAFPEFRNRILIVNSLSKTYAMTGWRIGYLAAPKQVINNALKASQHTITCVSPFIQKAAAFTLQDPGVQTAVTEMREAYARRRGVVLDIYKQYGKTPVRLTAPRGTFYFFLDMRALGLSSMEICDRILEETGVGLVPGNAFGAQGEGFVRMSIASSDEDVAQGFIKILGWAGSI